MSKNACIIYEDKTIGFTYIVSKSKGINKLKIICPTLEQHIPLGFFFFINSDNTIGRYYHPNCTDKTEEIARLIAKEVLENELRLSKGTIG